MELSPASLGFPTIFQLRSIGFSKFFNGGEGGDGGVLSEVFL